MDRSIHTIATNLFSLCGYLILMLIDHTNVGALYIGVKIAWFNNNL